MMLRKLHKFHNLAAFIIFPPVFLVLKCIRSSRVMRWLSLTSISIHYFRDLHYFGKDRKLENWAKYMPKIPWLFWGD